MVVDDHALFRRGVRMVLDTDDGIEVVGEAADGEEAIRVAASLKPDVVLMDLKMPRKSGLSATFTITEQCPETKVVVLTVSDESADLLEAFKAGAVGYLLKDLAIEEVASTVRRVHDGMSIVTPSLAEGLIGEFPKKSRIHYVLSKRELEILGFLAEGLRNREIAQRLTLSENTVKNHVRHILDKLRLNTRGQAAALGLREKVIEPPTS